MKNRFPILVSVQVLLAVAEVFSQATLNTTQIGFLDYQEDLSEVRGAVLNGREYALVGVRNGFSIVDLNDPANPAEVFFQPGPSSTWRDPFFYNDHAYCVTEGGGGMLIVDMSPLPGSTNLSTSSYNGSNYPWSTAHNMFIDEANGKAYIFGTDFGEGGAIILDISNPTAPVELGIWDDYYIHDGFVRGDTLWASCLEAGTFVVDVSTPSNPVVLTSWDTPSEFGHNVWPSDDNAYCYTTDEVESGFVAAYDMSDYQNIVEVDKVHHPLSEEVIPHNTHFIDDYIVTSHYRDGLTIHDVSDPSNIVLTGYFDSSPLAGGGFNGAWGAWPYLPSGIILVADIEEGLFVLDATYTRAARIAGNVTDFATGVPLNAVQVEILSLPVAVQTDLFGDYASGTEAAGTYEVSFAKGGYIPQTISGVELVNGQVTTLDVALVPETPITVGGAVTEEGSGLPIEGATVQFTNEFFDLEYVADAGGDYLDTTFFAGQYDVVISAWGYKTECANFNITGGSTSLDFDLEKGYYDDFVTDLGWSVSGVASAGVWERGIPVETTFNGFVSNVGEDVDTDCGEQAYVTGNDGGGAGNDDVDDGATVLSSPLMDLTTYTDPGILFDYWFFNGGGDGSALPNDTYKVILENGIESVVVSELEITNSSWNSHTVNVADAISITDQMRFIVEVSDVAPGHLVEGALDNFRVLEATGVQDVLEFASASIFPNPTSVNLNILIPWNVENGALQIYDAAGRKVYQTTGFSKGLNLVNLKEKPGVYICELIIDGKRQIERLLIQ